MSKINFKNRTTKAIAIAIAVCLLMLFVLIALGADEPQYEDRQIVISSQATPLEKEAAEVLQAYYYAKGGVKYDIVDDTAKYNTQSIVIGTKETNRRLKQMVRSEKLVDWSGENFEGLNDQGYYISYVNFYNQDSIAVLANTDVGVLNGVYALLEDFEGFGFMMSGDIYASREILRQINAGSYKGNIFYKESRTKTHYAELQSPAQTTRGIALNYDNFESAATFSLDDYKYIIDQLVKMRANYLQINNFKFVGDLSAGTGYSDGGTQIAEGFNVSEYMFKADKLITDYDFASDAFLHNTSLSEKQVAAKAFALLQQVAAYAEERNIKLGIGYDVTADNVTTDPTAMVELISKNLSGVDYIIPIRGEDFSMFNSAAPETAFATHFNKLYDAADGKYQIILSGFGLTGELEISSDIKADVIAAPTTYADAETSTEFVSETIPDGEIFSEYKEFWGVPAVDTPDSNMLFSTYGIDFQRMIDSYQTNLYNENSNFTGVVANAWRLADINDVKIFYLTKAAFNQYKFGASETGKVSMYAVYSYYCEKCFGRFSIDKFVPLLAFGEQLYKMDAALTSGRFETDDDGVRIYDEYGSTVYQKFDYSYLLDLDKSGDLSNEMFGGTNADVLNDAGTGILYAGLLKTVNGYDLNGQHVEGLLDKMASAVSTLALPAQKERAQKILDRFECLAAYMNLNSYFGGTIETTEDTWAQFNYYFREFAQSYLTRITDQTSLGMVADMQARYVKGVYMDMASDITNFVPSDMASVLPPENVSIFSTDDSVQLEWTTNSLMTWNTANADNQGFIIYRSAEITAIRYNPILESKATPYDNLVTGSVAELLDTMGISYDSIASDKENVYIKGGQRYVLSAVEVKATASAPFKEEAENAIAFLGKDANVFVDNTNILNPGDMLDYTYSDILGNVSKVFVNTITYNYNIVAYDGLKDGESLDGTETAIEKANKMKQSVRYYDLTVSPGITDTVEPDIIAVSMPQNVYEGQNIQFEITAIDDKTDEFIRADLYYRTIGRDTQWVKTAMTRKTGTTFVATIPGEYVTSHIEYFFAVYDVAVDSAGNEQYNYSFYPKSIRNIPLDENGNNILYVPGSDTLLSEAANVVIVKNANGEIPAAVTGLSASGTTLTWNKSDNAHIYRIYRGKENNFDLNLATYVTYLPAKDSIEIVNALLGVDCTGAAGMTSFIDADPYYDGSVKSGTYYYAVVAVDIYGRESAVSNYVSVNY